MSNVAAIERVESTAVQEYRGIEMAMTANEARQRLQELQAFVQSVMVEKEDYGTIPGTEKPTLFQPGAQKLAELYGLGWRMEDVTATEKWDEPFFFYRKKCIIFSRRTGQDIGEGVGSCNSREDRYAWRWVYESDIPRGVERASLHSKQYTSRNGKPYKKFRLANPDIYSLVNTIEKMAAKRAYVAAVISVTRSSALFTQDVEDLPREAFGSDGGAAAPNRRAPAAAPAKSDDPNDPTIPFGKNKGKRISQLSERQRSWYREMYTDKIAKDPSSKYVDEWRTMLAALGGEESKPDPDQMGDAYEGDVYDAEGEVVQGEFD